MLRGGRKMAFLASIGDGSVLDKVEVLLELPAEQIQWLEELAGVDGGKSPAEFLERVIASAMAFEGVDRKAFLCDLEIMTAADDDPMFLALETMRAREAAGLSATDEDFQACVLGHMMSAGELPGVTRHELTLSALGHGSGGSRPKRHRKEVRGGPVNE